MHSSILCIWDTTACPLKMSAAPSSLTLYADPQLTTAKWDCPTDDGPECLDSTNAIIHKTDFEAMSDQLVILVVWHSRRARKLLNADQQPFGPGNQLYDYPSCTDHCRQQAGVTTIKEMSACLLDQFQKRVLYPAAALLTPLADYSLRAKRGCVIKVDASPPGNSNTWILVVFPVLCTR